MISLKKGNLAGLFDATNDTFGKFVKSENTWNYLNTTPEYIGKQGSPYPFYLDKPSVLGSKKTK